MTNLNQLDLNVRLQLISCCFSALSATFADDLRYGRKCTDQDRTDLAMLMIYLEILECYSIIPEGASANPVSTLSTGTITVTLSTIGSEVIIYLDGVPIVTYTITSSNGEITADEIADLLTDAGYPSSSVKGVIVIQGPCSNGILGVTAGESTLIADGFTGGSCGIPLPSNCFTEEEIQEILEKVSKLTGLCFQPPGFEYEIPEGYTLDEETGTISPR